MILNLIVVANAAGAAAAAAQAKRREAQGLPPLPATQITPPTRADKIAEVAIWVMILAPGFLIAALVGGVLLVATKLAFAQQGIAFP